MSLEGSLETTVTDDAVEFTYTVTNAGDSRVELTFKDAGKADVAVFDGDDEHWRFSDGRMFAQMLSEEALAPGGQMDFQFTWEGPEPGSYTAAAELRCLNQTCETETEFSV